MDEDQEAKLLKLHAIEQTNKNNLRQAVPLNNIKDAHPELSQEQFNTCNSMTSVSSYTVSNADCNYMAASGSIGISSSLQCPQQDVVAQCQDYHCWVFPHTFVNVSSTNLSLFYMPITLLRIRELAVLQ
jgi:hypothetical protein